MERLIAFFFLLLIGCQSDFKRIHFASGATTSIARSIQPVGKSISYAELSYKEGHTFEITEEFVFDGLYGPRLGFPLTETEEGVILGLETEGRLRWARDGAQPYVGFHAGTAFFTEQWKDQGTDWGFTLGPLLGVKFGNWFLEYRYWHESNGTKVFGHNEGPNPGYNASLIAIGVEW